MAVRAKHAFTSAKPEGSDATKVRTSNWNADHTIQLNGPALIGKPTSGDGNASEVTIGGGLTFETGVLKGAGLQKSILSATQSNSTLTPAVLTGCTFVLAPGQSLSLQAILIFTGAATTTGAGFGVRVAQGAGADGNARGSTFTYVNLTSAASATGLADGDVFNVAAGANAYAETLGTATVAGNNSAMLNAVITNTSTNANTTVTVEFRSEVDTSAVVAQIGSGAIGIIG